MTRRLVHALAMLAALVAIAATGPASIRAASPAPDTLGTRVTSVVVVAVDPTLHVANLGTIPETFTFDAPTGWAVSPLSLTLAPGANGLVTLSGSGDPGTVTITGRAAVAVAGTDQSAIRFSARVMADRPLDLSGMAVGGFWLTVFLSAGTLGLYRFRPWEWRVTRKERPT